MIKAEKNKWFNHMFHLYTKHWLLKRSFYRIHIRGCLPTSKEPLLLVANHSNWWDGLIAFYLSMSVCKHDCYAMMSEDGLIAFPFFKKLGAFSVNPAKPRSLVQSMTYATDLLHQNKAIWVFPQGEEEHLEKRPLQLHDGTSYLLERVPHAHLIPITFYYTFLHNQRAELFIDIGRDLTPTMKSFNKKEKTIKLESHLTEQLNSQREAIITESTEDYQVLLYGQKTVSEWFSAMTTNIRKG
ncbi:lysophospholipid acyltransferase family protein [Bacillus suaedae]|uniref:Lysophospholipid acyltransferase family protein n=1 Tax=Halalkalibacter suaedae TaxID=2822140 RepID=A0A941AQE9_9BACI|nr:lysophospholipid acyltransferase family protein [Bacillus suaedae]MBP3951103.1 lysophospholipid acyltransferase family protein [Bacillus suaedae]